jgi:hypothetical protein
MMYVPAANFAPFVVPMQQKVSCTTLHPTAVMPLMDTAFVYPRYGFIPNPIETTKTTYHTGKSLIYGGSHHFRLPTANNANN